MTIDEIEKYYSENYEVVFDYAQLPEENDYSVYDCENNRKYSCLNIKDSNCKCRFCGKQKPEVSFRNRAHAVSETLGNKRIISIDNECDSCNLMFSKYEKDLTSFLFPFLILNGIKGKKGMRKYKTLDGKSSLTYTDDLIKICEKQGFTRVSENKDKHEMQYKYYSDGYVSRNIYKILVKMALSLLPEEKFNKFINASRALVSNTPTSGLEKLRFTWYPGLGVFDLIVRGYLRKGNDLSKPTYIFYLCCGNFSFQVPIYSDDDLKAFKSGTKLEIDLVGLDDCDKKMNGKKPTTSIIDCTEEELKNKGFRTFTLHYDTKKE